MVHAASRPLCSPGGPRGREALRLPSLPQEVPPRLHAARSPEDPHLREAFLLWTLWKAFNHSGNLSGHTLGSSPICAPNVTCLLLPGVSQPPARKPILNHWPRTLPSGPIRKFTMICHFCNTKGGWHGKSFGRYWVQGLPFTWMRRIFEWWLIFPFGFCVLFSTACFNKFLLSFVILLLKACLISYQNFIIKMSIRLTAFLLGGTSL